MRSCPTCHRELIDSQEVCPLDDTRLGEGDGRTIAQLGRVLGSYRLICLLGEGGMGSIYIGAHTRLNRYVAIKMLRPQLQHRKENISRFFDEARTINRIKHPNIVESIDLVEDVVDGAYCVLELLRGPDLKTRLRKGRLPLDSVIRIGAQVGDALSAVHAIGIVHRDLKPENLILIARDERDDFVKLIDFGVAQISDELGSGAPVGTAAYMAPEQAAGDRVDGRADVYALGVLLFEMATGQHPFPSSSDHAYLLAHADTPPPRPSKLAPSVPRELEAVILRCLAKKPDDRFPTAAAVASALRAIELEAPRRGRPWLAIALGTAAVAAAAVIVVPRYLASKAPAEASVRVPREVAARPAPMAKQTPVRSDAESSVTIELTSTPPGATVYRASETVPLGVTPFRATFPRGDAPLEVRLELAGHEPVVTQVMRDADHASATTLQPVKPVHAAGTSAPPPTGTKLPTTTKTKPVQREGTIDPFAP